MIDRFAQAFQPYGANFGKLPPKPGISSDYETQIICNEDGAARLTMTRWGMPSSKKALLDAATRRADQLRAKEKKPVDFDLLLRIGPTAGRRTSATPRARIGSAGSTCPVSRPLYQLQRIQPRCRPRHLVAFGEDRPTALFVGIWCPQWTSVRKVEKGEETADLFAFLTTKRTQRWRLSIPGAMPVMEECATWMTAYCDQAKVLQRRLPDGSMTIVARGVKKDDPTDPAQFPAIMPPARGDLL